MLEERIVNDYKEAMRCRETLKASALSMLRAEIMNQAIAKKKGEMQDEDILVVIRNQIQLRRDSIEKHTQNNRPDLVEIEGKKLAILEEYLPGQVPADELRGIISGVILSTGAEGLQDLEKVIEASLGKVSSPTDEKAIREMVREMLSSPSLPADRSSGLPETPGTEPMTADAFHGMDPKSTHILIVDDEPLYRINLRVLLSFYGKCQTAECGAQALAFFEAALEEGTPYHLVTVDIDLPDIRGPQVVLGIREREKAKGCLGSARILMVTASHDEEEVLACMQAGCNGYLVKPFDREKLRLALWTATT